MGSRGFVGSQIWEQGAKCIRLFLLAMAKTVSAFGRVPVKLGSEFRVSLDRAT